MRDDLDRLCAAYRREPMPDLATRLDRLRRVEVALRRHRKQLVRAVSEDFGNRAEAETLLMEVLPLLEGIKHHRRHLARWMRPERRRASVLLPTSRVSVHYQPLGVVGIVVPWNFPVFLGISPLIGALAAGNRVMLKLSEFTPVTAEAVRDMLASAFSEDEVVVVTGGVEVAREFTALPFDHLVFTGSTTVGRQVMRAAADNLTPVTLELGGKSPALVHESFPIEEAGRRLAFGKAMNAGQVCVAPDYVLVPADRVDAFCHAFAEAIATSYPTLVQNDDYTAIINDRQRARLRGYLDEVRDAGAEVVEVNPAGEDFAGSGKLPPTLVKDPPLESGLMAEEIFGPVLPVIGYDSLSEAIDLINARPRPLALYYFDWDDDRADEIIRRTHSGGVAVNDTLSHVAADDIPFGGIGPSGMGHYHGREGFLTFSKAKGVVRKGRFDPAALIGPPWGRVGYRALLALFWRPASKAR